jgi:hypothetical protein
MYLQKLRKIAKSPNIQTLVFSITLKMEKFLRFFGTHLPDYMVSNIEDHNMNFYRRENLKYFRR